MSDRDQADLEARITAAATGTTLSYWAARQPDAAAIVSPGRDGAPTRTWTFAELDADANRLARALRARGLGAGDAVAAMISNRVEFATTIAAAQRIGLRFTPINWHLTAEEAAYIVDDCEARAFVADARFFDVAAGAARQAGNASTLLAVGGEIPGFDDLDEAMAAESSDPVDDPVLGTTMLYTSGTTGRPKGVHRPPVDPRSQAAAQAARRVNLPPVGYEPGVSMHLCTGPLYHAAPLAFSLAGPSAAGVGVVLMDGWSAPETLRLIEEHRITHSHMVPTMFHRLLALPDDVRDAADLESLQFVWHGAAPCPVPVKRAIIEWWGPVLNEYYAATEGTGTFVGSDEWLTRPGTVGKVPVPDHVRILDEDGEALPRGEAGTIYLHAPETGRFRYFKDPDKTTGSYRGDYFTLGDVGYLDDDDYLYLTDRRADVINSGGVNIYSAEVEGGLLAHPAVADVAVIGIPDDDWGETVLAVVEPEAGIGTDDDAGTQLRNELIEHCRVHLAHYKCPRSIEFVAELPRADNGKLYKRRIRDEWRARAAAGELGDG